MKISNELKSKLIEEYNRDYKDKVIEKMTDYKPKHAILWVSIPIFLDGVLDRVRWNVRENRANQLEIVMSGDGNKLKFAKIDL